MGLLLVGLPRLWTLFGWSSVCSRGGGVGGCARGCVNVYLYLLVYFDCISLKDTGAELLVGLLGWFGVELK